MVSAIISAFVFPSTTGKPWPQGANVFTLSIRRFITLLKKIRQYPEAYKLCIGWILWNVSYSNFLAVFGLLFREELGLGVSDAEYTVYSFMSFIVASLGSLAWMWAYPRAGLNIKTWAYIFLSISIFTLFWGCLGIKKSLPIGFKHRAEFWVFEVFYVSSSSALRSLNRAFYSSMLPEGNEAQFFGLEIMLGVATGWIGPLVNATIQNRTGNLRYPMLPNLFVLLIGVGLYVWVDADKGMRDAEKLFDEPTDSDNEDGVQQNKQQRSPSYNSISS